MRYKDFNSNFNVIAEETITRFQQGGAMMGDFCRIRKDALKNAFLKDKPSQFVDMIKHLIGSDKHLKVSCVKTSKPDSQHELGNSPTDVMYVDIVEELAPGLWQNPITLPLAVIDILSPDGNNWSPAIPKSLIRADNSVITPKKVELTDSELNNRTQGNKRKLPTSNTKGAFAKEPKDGRSQTKVKG